MTTYRKSMSEALNQVRLGEDNMAMMKKAADGSMQTLKMKDGKLKMDSFTASAIMQVYKAVNPKNKKSIEKMINSGSKSQIMKLQSLAMKQIKSSYEEVDLDEDGHTDVASAIRKCMTVTEDAQDINSKLQTMSTEDSLPSWWTNKLAVASNDMNKMRDYIVNPVQEEVELDEGTWELPRTSKQKAGLKKALSKPIKLGKEGETARNVIGPFIGDDELFDDLMDAGDENPKSDARPIIKKAMKRLGIKEEVELDEAKYDLYHKDFSSAMQHAYKMAKKLHGITIDPKEIDDKVASGPKKPSSGKTNSYRLKGDKGAIQVQVYNMDNKKYELNMYKEEVELDEKIEGLVTKAKKSGMPYGILKKVYDRGMAAYKTGHRPGTTSQQWAFARVNSFTTKSAGTWGKADADLAKQVRGESVEEEIVEASARADAMRAMRKGKEVDPADVDTDASDDDVKAASKNIIMQLRKSVSLRGRFPVEFMDKKKVKVDAKVAQAVQNKYNSMRKADDKEKFQAKISKSYKDMLAALKEGFSSDAQRKAAFASGYKEKDKKKKEETILDRIDSKLKEKKNG